jgi:hypothetical protein
MTEDHHLSEVLVEVEYCTDSQEENNEEEQNQNKDNHHCIEETSANLNSNADSQEDDSSVSIIPSIAVTIDESTETTISATATKSNRPIIPKLALKPVRSSSPVQDIQNKQQQNQVRKRPLSNQRNYSRVGSRVNSSGPVSSSTVVSKSRNGVQSSRGRDSDSTVNSSSINYSVMSAGGSARRSISRERISRMFTPTKKETTRSSSAPHIRDSTITNEINPQEFQNIKSNLESQGMKYLPDGPNLHLDNFNQYNQNQKYVLTSPRSIEACLRTGISARELIQKSEEYFAGRGISKDVAKMRWGHYEQKRKEKVKLLREERQKIMEEDDEIQRLEQANSLNSTDVLTPLDQDIKRVERANKHDQSVIEAAIALEIQSRKKALERDKKVEEAKKKEAQLKEERERELKRIEFIRMKRHQEYQETSKKVQEKRADEIKEKQAWIEQKEKYYKAKLDKQQQVCI